MVMFNSYRKFNLQSILLSYINVRVLSQMQSSEFHQHYVIKINLYIKTRHKLFIPFPLLRTPAFHMPSPYLLYFTALYSDSRLTSLGGWDTTFENPQRFC
jgi:hypothetical protein